MAGLLDRAELVVVLRRKSRKTDMGGVVVLLPSRDSFPTALSISVQLRIQQMTKYRLKARTSSIGSGQR
jgi:hypothetical protein